MFVIFKTLLKILCERTFLSDFEIALQEVDFGKQKNKNKKTIVLGAGRDTVCVMSHVDDACGRLG